MADATRIFDEKKALADGAILRMRLWAVPAPVHGSSHRPAHRARAVIDRVLRQRRHPAVPSGPDGGGRYRPVGPRAVAGFEPGRDRSWFSVASDRTVGQWDGSTPTVISTRAVERSFASIVDPRTPHAAASFEPGKALDMADESGACSDAIRIVVAAAGSDTIAGQSSFHAGSPYRKLTLHSNGSNLWTFR